MKTHYLKCWPKYFQAIASGDKTFDVRNGDDRQFEVGDHLTLKEWDPDSKVFTGMGLLMEVTYVMYGPPLLPDTTWVLGIRPV